MDVRLQAKLLRVLQEGVVEPLGTNRRIAVDVRVISSTNRDLDAAMRDGRFREDLYYRLNVFRIALPPLRDRRDDVPALAQAFLDGFAPTVGKETIRLDEDAARVLREYAWPGNVRELRNVMERAAVLCNGPVVESSLARALVRDRDTAAGDRPPDAEPAALDLDRAVAATERRVILDALVAANDNKPAAAKLLGIGERTLWTKLKKHGI